MTLYSNHQFKMDLLSLIHSGLLSILPLTSPILLILWPMYSKEEPNNFVRIFMIVFILWNMFRSFFFTLLVSIIRCKKIYSNNFLLYGIIIIAVTMLEFILGISIILMSSVEVLRMSIFLVEFFTVVIIFFLTQQFFIVKQNQT